ncbi:MAG: Sjogren's syndrome/scleroderma autoantigen 1 family protein [Euryarchaeota archaeon]|nr:Sjogren's syndrome/scleroderma autoantigen 1 family protein [Euryarchaeota archaeon]
MNSDDKKIKQISRLLELGGTMLAQHCNTCGSPMFRYQGQVLCPVCQVMNEQEMMSGKTEKQSSKVPSSSDKDVTPAPSTTPPEDTIMQPLTIDSGAGTGASKGAQNKPLREARPEGSTPDKEGAEYVDMNADMRQLDELILAKITEIARQIQDENDPRSVEESFELIKRGLDILKNTKTL